MSALTEPQQIAVNNLRAWVDRIFAETISDNRLKATLVSESLDKYGIASATLARVMGLDAASLAAFLAQRIASGEIYQMDTEGGIESAPYLQFSKVKRQLLAEKAALKFQYRGAMGDEWLTNLLAVKLVQNGIHDINDFARKNRVINLPVETPLVVEYDLDSQPTGRILYRWFELDPGWGNRGRFEVAIDPANVQWFATGDESPRPWTNRALSLETEYRDYYYNKATGQRLDLFSSYPEDTIYIDETGHGASYFLVKFPADGPPIFYASLVVPESWWQQVAPLLSIVAMALTYGGAAAWLGGAVLGAETAAAYPVLANATGKLIISTALSGGDVAQAATKLAAGFAGGYFGDVLGTGLDSAAIGAVANSVISTAIEGGDIRMAAAQTIAQLGIAKMDDFFTDDYAFDPGLDVGYSPDTGFDFMTDVSFPDEWGTLEDLGINADAFAFSDWLSNNEGLFIEAGFDVDSISVDMSGNLYLADGYYVEMAPEIYADSFYVDQTGNVYAPDNTLVINSSDALAMTEGELSAKLYQDWQGNQGAVRDAAPAPAVRPDSIPPAASQTKIPSINDVASTFDKLLSVGAKIVQTIRQIKTGSYTPVYSQYPGGIPRVQAVGVPVQQSNGSTITNNGNGTQTIRYPDGRTDVIQTSYAGVSGGGSLFGLSSNTLLIAGGLGLAALLIAKRK